jgi:hypothetical protein
MLVSRLVPPRQAPPGARPPANPNSKGPQANPFPTPAPTAKKIMAVFSTENLVASSNALLADANSILPFPMKRQSNPMMKTASEEAPAAAGSST